MQDNDSSIVPAPKLPEIETVQTIQNPYKEEAYQKFIATVKNGQIPAHWELLAETLGVHRKTIEAWRKLPEFSEAVNAGLDEALEQMKKTGGKDWRQWRERVAILSREKKNDAERPINVNTQINLQKYVEDVAQ